MKKRALMITAVVVFIFVSFSFLSNPMRVKGDDGYTIEYVEHEIGMMYNGYVLMNDTIQISGQPPNTFLFGLPYRLGFYVLWYAAFDANTTSMEFQVTPGVQFENRSGFYGLRIDFPAGMPQNLRVQILLSNRLIAQESQNTSLNTLIFPTFPSFTQMVNMCNSSVILPDNAQYVTGSVTNTTYSQNNLLPFTYNISTITFQMADAEMQVFDVDELTRQIAIDESGEVTGSDSYSITNKALQTMTSIEVVLPANASDVTANDQLGRIVATPTLLAPDSSRYGINITSATSQPLEFNESTQFIVNYRLLSNVYLTHPDAGNTYAIDMVLFKNFDYYVNETNTIFILPEGAKFQSFGDIPADVSYSLTVDVFQNTVTLSRPGVSSLTSYNLRIAYDYSSLWSAFRPTIWAMVLSILGCLAIVVIRRPKAPTRVSVPTTAVQLRPEYLRSFLDSYEEKMKIIAEMDSLDDKARKGRIQRQRYKIQRKTLETRLDSLSRNLEDLKNRIRAAGSRYANLVHQLETAETELNEVEINVKSLETRHNRGELPLESYRKLLDDYQRRKEKTETTMDGILLRLREEMR